MRTRSILPAFACLCIAISQPARAEEAIEPSRIDALESRIEQLEDEASESVSRSGASDWTRRIRLGGSAEIGYFDGGDDTAFDPDTYLIWDTRFFLDADLGSRVELGDSLVFRNIAMTFEWDLVRRGELENRVGELYVDFQSILGFDPLNVQFGRFQIPVGEAYKLYSQGRPTKFFVSDPVGGPWWWDEGARIYGSANRDRIGYVASVTDGDTAFNAKSTNAEQFTLKLFWRPTPWLYLSMSGLRSGKLGSSDSPASGALWLGEAWARAFGSGSGVDNYQDGVIIPDGPNVLRNTWFAGADTILTFEDKARLWFAYGRYSIDSQGGGVYDRVLHYWIAEVVIEAAWISPALRPFFLGFRAAGLGTYDDDRGYLVDRDQSQTIGYNTKSVTDYSTSFVWHMNDYVELRLEYTHRDLDLVRGVSSAIRNKADDLDSFAVEIAVSL